MKSKRNQVFTEIGPIEHVPTATLVADPENPRQHSNQQVRQLARSIETFGLLAPLIVDRENRIVCGNALFLAAQKLELDEIPVIRVKHLSSKRLKAFQIAHNRLAEHSHWDDQLLGKALYELTNEQVDFDLEVTGFATTEIDLRIEDTRADSHKRDDDSFDQPQRGTPVSRIGDTWRLGRHRLICGNALEEAVFRILLKNELASQVIADFPYNVRIKGHAGGKGRIQHDEFQMASGEMSEAEFHMFLSNVIKLLVRFSTDGSLHYLFMDWRHILTLLIAGNPVYSELKNICVWVKPNGGMGSLYRSRHELVAVYKSGRAAHRNNIDLGRHGRNRTNVWEYPGINSFRRHSEEGNLLTMHPTVKPVQMIADALLDSTARGDLVMDPFLGSGSSLIAAERTGRSLRAIEIDPRYVDVAINRWEKLTGETAILEPTDRTFSEEARSRACEHPSDAPSKSTGEE